ncbi:DEAD/DEAH box helicase [Streptomyces sp. NBC_00151]|uniref:DEAD/DEAH box helicase n=1 Tax=Streptomyces sp. NBC_00151 TaxID=2975669 RepID=UPI002DDBE915|nr:DEAD/DEAH box helicase [Streptomyces sp. NBC_00151]WRZ42616.1 DEAD/DEAH box helicase [Streptomyces sp. NBC_00151]
MDVFGVHQNLISDYSAFTNSLVSVRDRDIQQHLDEERARKARWPDPRISLNPNFRSGGTVAELVDAGVLHPMCRDYFRVKEHEHDPGSRTLTLHRHQREAIDAAARQDSYVLTTGTGSGKSLAYIVPIVNEVLRHPNPNGISAIVVYPMNALANSQEYELARYLKWGIPEANRRVSFARYTGQENAEGKAAVLRSKPDILLTNYVMLEYLLTRPHEREELIGAAQGLRFLALDELHTYRGRQGADVAFLVRRLRDACAAPALQCIGTSATMASAATFEDAQEKVADIATRLFGTLVRPKRVIGETLERSTDPGALLALSVAERRAALAAAVRRAEREPLALPQDYSMLKTNPLAIWVEDSFGLVEDEKAEGQLVRRTPITVPAAAVVLSGDCGESQEVCRTAIEAILRAGAKALHPQHERPLFAFRLHQFLSKGDTVYTSFEPAGQRHLTSQYQVSVPAQRDKPLIPLAFCRDCGHEYLVVTREDGAAGPRFVARRDPEAPAEDGDGYLYVSEERPWPTASDDILGRLPDSWVETTDDGTRSIVQARSGDVPREVWIAPDGAADAGTGEGLRAWWVSAPFRFCLRCRVSHEQLRARDFAKLATFAAEGRSSAVSLICSSVVRSLRGQQDIDERARKLLTFVDNRQDASLQAGHFNDFAQVTQIRGALYRALAAAGPTGLSHDALPQAVEEALGLPMEGFARNPGAKYSQRESARSALRAVLGYRVNADLERGWRITMPNLTQTGLLRFEYTDLREIAGDQECWQGAPAALADDSPEHREYLARVLLDELRRSLAVDEPLLTQEGFDQLQRQSDAQLLGVWALPPKEPRVPSRVAFPGSGPKGAPSGEAIYLSGLGAYGRFLRRPDQFRQIPGLAGKRMPVADADAVIRGLLRVLETQGLVAIVREERDGSLGHQVRAAALRWLPGDGLTPEPDPLRKVSDPGAEPHVNTFFRDLYRDTASQLVGLEAREHTAQVPSDLREKREKAFRDGDLSLLYCSPTMELGVDIATLNAVAMRNAPPTPANYAQRSGRAGRSGQPALVTTYCSTGSAHDQYYFRRPELMVAGSVTPPRLDLANEELLRSHVHAIWLAETGVALGRRMTDFIDAEAVAQAPGEPVPLRLTEAMRTQLDSEAARRRAIDRATAVLEPLIDDLRASTTWWYDGWIEDVVRTALRRFDDDCERWRRLYRASLAEREEQHRIAGDLSVDPRSRRRAQARRAEAENQLKLLRNEDSEESFSDFYTYRYFASEGFLPGYSFPRLPLAAYIPGQRGEGRLGQKNGAYIQRPRFIAISEFGPGALIYHEGQRYAVDRVQVPMGATPGQVATSDVRICSNCGTWYDRSDGIDRCDDCGVPLSLTLSRTMVLSTVQASPVRRISSDEEERLRSGFELLTGYQFSQGGGRLDATATDDDGPVLTVGYGDTARVRVFNIGRRKRKHPADRGFWLDPIQGRWLSAKKAGEIQEASAEDEALSPFASADRTVQVIPYVEDRKNIAVLRLAEPVENETVAVTLRYALERGIEARYQLEDAELDSQDLPDDEQRGRMLLIEGAEGGAGVLRLLHDDSGALAEVAREALRIIHVDPDDGRDLDRAPGAVERCERGCYDCLLTYSNQRFHTRIDRLVVVPLLMRLAASTTQGERQVTPAAQRAKALALATEDVRGPVAEFVEWLGSSGHRLPDETHPERSGDSARPDVVYRLPGADVAVYVDEPGGWHLDRQAEFRLIDDGWLVIRAGADTKEWENAVRAHPDVFGPGRSIR